MREDDQPGRNPVGNMIRDSIEKVEGGDHAAMQVIEEHHETHKELGKQIEALKRDRELAYEAHLKNKSMMQQVQEQVA